MAMAGDVMADDLTADDLMAAPGVPPGAPMSADDDLGAGLPPELWSTGHALAVVAHPDDESFGLGGVLAWLTSRGVVVDLVCLTAGEASSLGAAPHLGDVRTDDLQAAALALGIRRATMVGRADGHLADDQGALESTIAAAASGAGAMVCLEPSGVTGHPDHKAVAAAVGAVAARAGIPVVEWGLSPGVTLALRHEVGVTLAALEGPDVIEVRVDRSRHRAAIACHESQQPTNPVLTRRLELQGTAERVRIRTAPFAARLARFVDEATPLARPDSGFDERQRLLDLLVAFAAGSTWPPGAFDADPDRPYAVHCLHDERSAFSLATVVLDAGHATPPHDHQGWGAAATISGVERNVRLAGRCPDLLRPLDAQLVPRGASYLFAVGDIHQASSAGNCRSASVHLLVVGGDHAHQRCREPA